MNLLIPYVYLYDHPDPAFDEFTYGDSGARSRKLKNDLAQGDYIFFHTSILGKKYITAYYVIDRVLDTTVAGKDRNIVSKFKNPHITEYLAGARKGADGDVVMFGDPITSRVLDRPLLFNKALAERLSLGIGFADDRSDTQCIGSATRAWRELTGEDVDVLLQTIAENPPMPTDAVLSTDEVMEIIEKDIEGFIEKNPGIIGESVTLDRRQLNTSVGRIDLLFKDKKGDFIVVELKLNQIGRDAVSQIQRYMDWLRKETKKNVTGVLVCKGVMPAFEADFTKLKNIKILCYGWQLKLYPWHATE